MYVTLSVKDIEDGLRVMGELHGEIDYRLKEAVHDVADALEEAAILNAPDNRDPAAYTWRDRPSIELKEQPVDRKSWTRRIPSQYFEEEPGGTVIDAPLFVGKGQKPGSGGYAVKGAGGRFVKRRGFTVGQILATIPGFYTNPQLVAYEELTVTEVVPYAIFVHNGTAPYTAKNADFMMYTSALCKARTPRLYKLKSVAGQAAQPYMQWAYNEVEPAYTNARVAQLRAELGLIT